MIGIDCTQPEQEILLADQARESRWELKILFVTGYAENVAFANGLLQPAWK